MWRRVAQTCAQVAGKVFVDRNPLDTLMLPVIARLLLQQFCLVQHEAVVSNSAQDASGARIYGPP